MHDMETENYEAYLHGIEQFNLWEPAPQVGQQVGDKFPLDSNVGRRVWRLSSSSVVLQFDFLSTQ